MTRTRYRFFETEYPYLLTCTVVGWLPVFNRPECAAVVLDSLRHMHESGRFTLFGYVLLENHLHLIAWGEQLSEEVGRFKSFTARTVIDFLRDRGESTLLEQLAWEK